MPRKKSPSSKRPKVARRRRQKSHSPKPSEEAAYCGLVVCAQAARRQYLCQVLEDYSPGVTVKVRTYATATDAIRALKRCRQHVDSIIYSRIGGANAKQEIPRLQKLLPTAPVIVEFAGDQDESREALEMLRLGVYNVLCQRIDRAEMFREMLDQARNGQPPYKSIWSVQRPRGNWGFMSMVFRLGDLDSRDYLDAIQPVMEKLGLDLKRDDEIDPRELDLRKRVQQAIPSRDVVVAQVSSQTSNQ